MPLDPGAKRFLALVSASANRAHRSPAKERRIALNELIQMAEDDCAERCAVENASIAGSAGPLGIRIYSPDAASDIVSPALLYLHGGGWVAGGFGTHDMFCMRLAEACGFRIAMVDYRLAPEHRFPAALEDGLRASGWLLEHGVAHGIDPIRLGICGDSAGANIAAAVCLAMKRSRGPRFALQLLLCPILDAIGDVMSRRSFASGYFLDRAMIESDFDDYCPPGVDRRDERISPMRAADLSGLPPTQIHTAEFDPVRDEGALFGERLVAAHVPVSYKCHAGMIHLFYGLPRFIPSAESILRDVGAAVRSAFYPPPLELGRGDKTFTCATARSRESSDAATQSLGQRK